MVKLETLLNLEVCWTIDTGLTDAQSEIFAALAATKTPLRDAGEMARLLAP